MYASSVFIFYMEHKTWAQTITTVIEQITNLKVEDENLLFKETLKAQKDSYRRKIMKSLLDR